MIKRVETILQIIAGFLVLVNFFFPSDFMENSRINYLIYFIKNISFEIIVLLFIIVLFTTKIGNRKRTELIKNWSYVKFTEGNNKRNTFLIFNYLILMILSLYLGSAVLIKRINHYTLLRSKYYVNGMYEAEFLGKKGNINAAINSYNSFAVSLNKGVPEQNSIISSRIEKLKFQKRLSERYFLNFEDSFKSYGLTRINFFMLVESYFLNPYDPIIKNKLEETLDLLERGINYGPKYFQLIKAGNKKAVMELDSLYFNTFIENGVINVRKYTDKYWEKTDELLSNFSEYEYVEYLEKSWQYENIRRKLEIIENNKQVN
tara:strand:+ start:1231 stop:2184 length:954 start_codon:yes stop_codon:yes gene_type:complete